MDERGAIAAKARTRRAAPGSAAADALPSAVAVPQADVASAVTGQASAPAILYDPRDPAMLERLKRRMPGAGYEVGEAELVRCIRAWGQRGEQAVVRCLCELLVERCLPEMQRRCWGLRHRPELFEDAIAGMVEQLLREVRDPREQFMTLNFIHYLHCLCADNFGRVLRQEGLSYRRDAAGRPTGRPQHVPRALMDRIDVTADEREDGGAQGLDIPASDDPLAARLGALEAQRILTYLPDALDRRIMILRVFEQMRWDDIARLCGKTERTMRLRYEKARTLLRERIAAEQSAASQGEE